MASETRARAAAGASRLGPLKRVAIVAVALLSTLAVGCGAPAEFPEASSEPARSVAELLGEASDAEGFARATAPREFVFPADHGPHPEFRTEWWYFVGNVADRDGNRYGYQLTFFRNALSVAAPDVESGWAARDAWMAHFALTDAAGRRFASFERFARGALGLAGARAEPFAVWLEDWRAEAAGGSAPPFSLTAADGDVKIDLELIAEKPHVLQGDAGLSRKGLEPGQASYYYAYTRLATRGSLTVGGVTREVEGSSWLDREWSTSSLSAEQVGWDWFALQLDDGSELMVYRMRLADGGADVTSAATFVPPSGAARKLARDDVELEVLERWRSPQSGAVYPARWRIAVPAEGLEVEVEPLLSDQELRHSFRYWEGAVRFRGSRSGRPVAGRGYVELTGY